MGGTLPPRMHPGDITFRALSREDPLHRALGKVGELYSATNFQTWWDARAFEVGGRLAEAWDPADIQWLPVLSAFIEVHVLDALQSTHVPRFGDHVAKVGRVEWKDVREGLMDALRHNPVSGGSRPGTTSGQLSPHSFMLLEIVEDQVAAALSLGSGRQLAELDRRRLRNARLRPTPKSSFSGTLYQHLFLCFAPESRRLLWFDLGGST